MRCPVLTWGVQSSRISLRASGISPQAIHVRSAMSGADIGCSAPRQAGLGTCVIQDPTSPGVAFRPLRCKSAMRCDVRCSGSIGRRCCAMHARCGHALRWARADTCCAAMRCVLLRHALLLYDVRDCDTLADAPLGCAVLRFGYAASRKERLGRSS